MEKFMSHFFQDVYSLIVRLRKKNVKGPDLKMFGSATTWKIRPPLVEYSPGRFPRRKP